MNRAVEVELLERTVAIRTEDIVKIQALWRGYSTRKCMQKLQDLYSQIFEEIEESPEVLPYWPLKTNKKPVFLRKTEYAERKSEDERLLEERQHSNTTKYLPCSKYTENTDIKSVELGNQVNYSNTNTAVKERVSQETEKTNSVYPFDEPKDVQSKVAPEDCEIKSEAISEHKQTASSTKRFNNVEDLLSIKDEVTNNIKPQNSADTSIQGNNGTKVTTSDNTDYEGEMSLTPSNGEELTNGSHDKDNSQRQPVIKNVQQNQSRNKSGDGGPAGLVSENSGIDTEEEPVKFSGTASERTESSEITQTQTLQQTSYWESEQNPESEDFDPSDWSPEELKKQRSVLGMELLWVQQAIESRKQYLRLKADIST